MPVTRLRLRRDKREVDGLRLLRRLVLEAAEYGAPVGIAQCSGLG
mgnify:CR=1 FL=1